MTCELNLAVKAIQKLNISLNIRSDFTSDIGVVEHEILDAASEILSDEKRVIQLDGDAADVQILIEIQANEIRLQTVSDQYTIDIEKHLSFSS